VPCDPGQNENLRAGAGGKQSDLLFNGKLLKGPSPIMIDPGYKRSKTMHRSEMMPPLVSVIIAVKNSARYLADCLNSVAAQTFIDYEIIVVDGWSTDGTEAIARSYEKVRFFQQQGTGFADGWNSGMQHARGEYFAFIDSDDRWVPDKLADQVAMLQNNPKIEAVIGKVRFFVEPGETPSRTFSAKVLGRDHIGRMPGTLLARRGLFERIGDWGENDLDWFLKVNDSGVSFGVVDSVLLHKRVHGRNFSYMAAENASYPKEILRFLHNSILRKRATNANRRPTKAD
jgi:glycosyltransferase involved in cell wall biosynthesis